MEPILSIIVPVYNHEKYVVQALDSIQEQHIKYSFEVIIGEDCSSDGSRQILFEYEKKTLPNYLFIYRNKNLGMFDNITDLFYKARGKYVIMLEADDYWSYPNKINQQIDFLENNEEYSGYAHSVIVINENDVILKTAYECEKGDGIYEVRDYLRGKLPGQTASFMYRNYFKSSNYFDYMKNCKYYALDRFIAYVVASKGDVFCTSEKWSVYRYIVKSGSSYSANLNSKSKEFALGALKYHLALYKYSLHESKRKECILASEKLYFKSFLRDWRDERNSTLEVVIKEFLHLEFPIRTLLWVMGEYIKYLFR